MLTAASSINRQLVRRDRTHVSKNFATSPVSLLSHERSLLLSTFSNIRRNSRPANRRNKPSTFQFEPFRSRAALRLSAFSRSKVIVKQDYRRELLVNRWKGLPLWLPINGKSVITCPVARDNASFRASATKVKSRGPTPDVNCRPLLFNLHFDDRIEVKIMAAIAGRLKERLIGSRGV